MRSDLLSWNVSMAASLAESANDARISLYLRDCFPYPYTPEAAAAFIAYAAAESERGDLYRAIVADGRVVGGISVARRPDVCRRSAEIGYWLNPAFWGKGIMTESVRRLCRTVFAETDIVRIEAEVLSPNISSCRVLEKCGFVLEGVKKKGVFKNGAFFDNFLYALIKE